MKSMNITMKKINKSFLYMHHSGSYSVEAALIMPIVLGVIILAIYLAFYTHDKMVAVYSLIRAESICNDFIMDSCNSPEVILDQVDTIVMSNMEKALIGKWNGEVEVGIDDENLKIVLNGQMNNSQELAYSLIGSKAFVLRAFCKSKLINECEWVRTR